MGNSFIRISTPRQRETQPKASRPISARRTAGDQHEGILGESVFHSMLTLERRRADRSDKPFVLMLIDANLENTASEEIMRDAVQIMAASKRETDLAGWYKQKAILGIIFTEVNTEGEVPVTEILRSKIETSLTKHLGRDRASKIAISVHLFPESWEKIASNWAEEAKLYPALTQKVS